MDLRIEAYIARQKSPQKEICQRLREILFKVFPGIEETWRWGAMTYADGTFYIGALRDSVNLGVAIAGMTKAELALFEGSGKTMRHIKIKSLDEIDEERIAQLLKLVKLKRF